MTAGGRWSWRVIRSAWTPSGAIRTKSERRCTPTTSSRCRGRTGGTATGRSRTGRDCARRVIARKHDERTVAVKAFKPGPKPPPREDAGLPPLTAATPAGRVLEFLEKHLRHVKGRMAGRPMILEPWQIEQIVTPLFNTLTPEGLRQYRTCYVTVPRKNGKSTIAAALALYLLYADAEPGADIISAAADREQAAVVFDIAREMVEKSRALNAITVIYRRELYVPSTNSRYKVISSEAYSKHGMNLHAAVIDELHAHEDRRLYDVLTTSTGAREQPLTFIITTASSDEHSIATEVHRYAEKVRDGIIPDPTFLPIIYGAPEDADPWDEAVWRASNPAIESGFRSLEELRTM